MKKKIFIIVVLILISIIIMYTLQELLKPKYMTTIFEGNLTKEYYMDKSKHDVLIFGDCEVFSNISPISLWEEYGITSFIRGNAKQLIWQSYYLLEDSLRYEKPDLVVFNVLAMKYDEPQNEAYNRLALDGMKLSLSKIKAIKASKMEDESTLSYIFPILRYHSRWSDLTKEDFKYIFKKDEISHNGYLMRVDIKPVGYLPKEEYLSDYTFGDNSYFYLDKINHLCKANGIDLVLIKAPSLYPYWHDEWDEQIVKYAKENQLLYVNFLERNEEIGIDYSVDTYDGGLHLNLSGAEKFTSYLGKILKDNYKLEDHRQDKDLKKIWNEKIEFYNMMIEKQEVELKED